MTEWIRPRGHDIAVLFSRRSRDAYAAEAAARGETYTFTDAWGRPRTWLKGEHAYLAPSGASVLLARCNLKHDIVKEADLTDAWLADCRRWSSRTPRTLERDHRADRALAARPRSPSDRHREDQSPAALLGFASSTPTAVTGYTGWRWRKDSPFAGHAWEKLYVSGYPATRRKRSKRRREAGCWPTWWSLPVI